VVEEFAGRAGVAADDGAGPARARMVRGGGLAGQDAGRRLTELNRQGGGEQVVGQAAHTVGAEESCHERVPPVV